MGLGAFFTITLSYAVAVGCNVMLLRHNAIATSVEFGHQRKKFVIFGAPFSVVLTMFF
jgi:hypothetical protein